MQNKTKRLATNAMLSALCAVLGFIALDFNVLKITLESFPVNMGALLFGPVDGAVIAFIGSFIYQLLKYGVSATTALWIAPGVISAVLSGWYAKKKDYQLTKMQMVVAVLLAELVVTVLNTGVMYIDAKMYGYYFPGFITGSLIPRLAICVGKGIVYGVILHPMLDSIKKALKLS